MTRCTGNDLHISDIMIFIGARREIYLSESRSSTWRNSIPIGMASSEPGRCLRRGAGQVVEHGAYGRARRHTVRTNAACEASSAGSPFSQLHVQQLVVKGLPGQRPGQPAAGTSRRGRDAAFPELSCPMGPLGVERPVRLSERNHCHVPRSRLAFPHRTLLGCNRVVLYMKDQPSMPQCGFSAKASTSPHASPPTACILRGEACALDRPAVACGARCVSLAGIRRPAAKDRHCATPAPSSP